MSTPAANAVLHTPRLVLQPPSPALAAALLAFHTRNQAHLAPWDPPQPPGFLTLEFQRQRLRLAAADARRGTALRWFLRLRLAKPGRNALSPEVVGSLGLSQIVRGAFHSAMLGYSLDAHCERRGLMAEAVEAVVEHAFGPAVGLHRIQANARTDNTRSLALLARTGFEREGVAREYLYIDGAWRDHVMHARRNPAFRFPEPAPAARVPSAHRPTDRSTAGPSIRPTDQPALNLKPRPAP